MPNGIIDRNINNFCLFRNMKKSSVFFVYQAKVGGVYFVVKTTSPKSESEKSVRMSKSPKLFGLLDGRVVGLGCSIIFGLSALSSKFGAKRSIYYEIDTPAKVDHFLSLYQ